MLLLAFEVFVLNPAMIFALAYLPGYLLFLWFIDGGRNFGPAVVFVLLLAAAWGVRKAWSGSDVVRPDLPLLKALGDFPALEQLTAQVAGKVRRKPPREVQVALSPAPWQSHGVDLRASDYHKRGLALPLTCLGIWSVSELEAHIARSLVMRRSRWLLPTVGRAMERLNSEQYQVEASGRANRFTRARRRALNRYGETVALWRFLVDLEADLRVVAVTGTDALLSVVSTARRRTLPGRRSWQLCWSRRCSTGRCCRWHPPMPLTTLRWSRIGRTP